jgi:DNA-directed RNA polymerase specialized sigma24 family protein
LEFFRDVFGFLGTGKTEEQETEIFMSMNSELLEAIQRNQRWIEKKCRICEKDQAKCEELINDILLNLYSSSDNFSKKDSVNADAWIKRIATNVTASHIQKEIAEKRIFDKKTKDAEIHHVEKPNAYHDLSIVMDYINTNLSEKDREIMSLYLMQESQAVISEIMGLEVATITNRISIIKKELNAFINKGEV